MFPKDLSIYRLFKDMEQAKLVAFKVPTVILSWTRYRKPSKKLRVWSVRAFVTSSLLIFIDCDDRKVFIGCFSCDNDLRQHPYKNLGRRLNYDILLVELLIDIHTFEDISMFWTTVNSKLHFEETDESSTNCFSITTDSKGEIDDPGEECATYHTFFQYINCSNFDHCKIFFQTHIELAPQQPHELRYKNREIFHYGHKQVDYTFQILIPFMHPLDIGLRAFLSPFLLRVWLLLLVTLVCILLWLVLLERQKIVEVLFLQLSILLEQDPYIQSKMNKIQSHVVVLVFIFSAIALRQFYLSCLYSFIVMEPQATDYPKTIREVLNRTEFEIFTPITFWYEIEPLFWTEFPKSNRELAMLFENIVLRSFFMKERTELQTLYNVSARKAFEIYKYTSWSWSQGWKLVTVWGAMSVEKISSTFSRFAVVCNENCDGYWKLPFLGQTQWYRVSEMEMRFLSTHQFWSQMCANFATLKFSRFLGRFVDSGLHGWVSRRYNVQMRYEMTRTNGLRNLDQAGIYNGSLWSYLMLGNDVRRLVTTEEEATKASALIGILVIMTMVLMFGIIVLGLEILNLI
ncbi:unnamed protein product [Orchesella dallaii]|uniref:Uncharacterized protein n=1 Tax=Orchesella dallaii TaxID=48710 RepID=A0ABP1RPY9_9HEXA